MSYSENSSPGRNRTMKPLNETKLNVYKCRRALQRKERKGIKTGIPSLDRYLLGLGGLVSIQGETSSCKSCLGLQIVHYNLNLGTPVIMIDKENGEGRVVTRLMCQSNKLSEEQLQTSTPVNKEDFLTKIDSMPIHLHTESIMKMEFLEARVKECWEIYKRPFIVLFDSIQAADMINNDQRVNLEQWVYFLDRLKVEYSGRITIIIVSEKNRSSYGLDGVGGGKGSNVVDYKPETILDIKWAEITDTFWVKVSKHRDGVRGGSFELKKVLTNPDDKRSFCFLLEDVDAQSEEKVI